MKHLFNCLVLFAVTVVMAVAAPIPVPLTVQVTPPPPSPIQVQVSQSVTVGNQAYTVTGTLTFTPSAGSGTPVGMAPLAGGNPVPASLQSLPDATPVPMIAGYKNPAHEWIKNVHPGDTLFIEGRGWGKDKGSVIVESLMVDALEWLDEEIGIRLPQNLPLAPNGILLTVRRSDGKSSSVLGPVVSR